ncbi:ShlB/FhaC/HecB family hemolysin secretion/activation protein [Aliarcobacter cryaerophilus]|uniref:ShlB/FhaC/HecB family hemolysin secretion/activation protein n=1 Tax=Aliarcobacter cryaerophilus TaxID=28198 RepID=UPI0021B6A3A3|nr:ShlB/FhaC/HecB family hemolysin secretion/activation protein [Aliarcobacter cryaerophilus]MCT7531272.1 ShlB/FhaC/HecB family hemolysin secretion/activation protein [Aliarcobacter cryaerophilus]
MKTINKIITLSVLSSVALLGSSPIVPNSSIIERQIQSPKDIPTAKKEIVEIEGSKEQKVLKDNGSNQTILIKNFNVQGNTKISNDDILNSLKEFENKELNFNQIQEIATKISKLYKDRGYFVARAYLPAQNIQQNQNILNISILEGNYGEFNIDNNSLVRNSVVQDIFDNTKFDKVINTKVIERAMLLINDRAGVKISKAQLSPGTKVGSSDFNIETVSEPRVDGYVVSDNYGSRYTGEYRLQALVNINSLATLGDQLSVSGLISNGADLKNGRLAYELPLNSYGLKTDFAYTRTNYNLVEEYKSLDAKGNSTIYEAGLSYPLIRTTNENLYLKGKYYHKDMNDYMSGDKYEDKSINSFVTTLEYDKNYSIGTLPARVFANLNLTTGHLSSKNSNPNNGNYNKVDTYISNDIYFNEIFSLNTNLTAQKVLGNKNLDGSEDLSLGGPNAVKLYPYSEQSGENGYIASFELFSKLPNIASYNHKIGLFYDMGNVYQERNLDTTFQRKTLQDIGLGYYSSFDDFFLRAQIAWGLNSKPISSEYTNHKNSKFLIQAGLVF